MRSPLLLLIALALSVPALAADPKPKDKDDNRAKPERHVDPQKASPEARAARKAKDMNGGGRVLSVTPEQDGHRVKVLKKGEVQEIHVPSDEGDANKPQQGEHK